MPKRESTIVFKIKADTSELMAALDECKEKAEELAKALERLGVARGRGVSIAATRETR